MRTGEDKFTLDVTTIEDHIAEICSNYNGVKRIEVKKSILHPFEIEIILEGTVDNTDMAQHIILDLYPIIALSDDIIKRNLSAEIDRIITNAKLFSKGGSLR